MVPAVLHNALDKMGLATVSALVNMGKTPAECLSQIKMFRRTEAT